jgi:hypothetical protein
MSNDSTSLSLTQTCCYAAAKCRTWVGQLTVGWRVGKARERWQVRSSVWQGFIAASQLAHNGQQWADKKLTRGMAVKPNKIHTCIHLEES